MVIKMHGDDHYDVGHEDDDVGGVIHLGVSWVLGSWLVLGGCRTGGGTWWKNINICRLGIVKAP